MNSIFLAILLSISPISELRGGIPYILSVSTLTFANAIALPLICILANILVVLPVFFFLDFLHHRFLGINFYRKLFNLFITRIQRKAKKLEPQINKYGYISLALFVAVPLPVTGAWTGALIALGVLIAGVIVTLLTLAGLSMFRALL